MRSTTNQYHRRIAWTNKTHQCPNHGEYRTKKYYKPVTEKVVNMANVRSICACRKSCDLPCKNCGYYNTKYCIDKAGE